MSWLFSRALVEEFLGENFSDGEPSAPSSGNHIPQAFCAPDKTTAFSRLSRFGMTFRPLTESRGEELLMSYLAGFPARTSPQPEKARASKGRGRGCGSTWRGSLMKFDPASCSWRTAQCSFLEDSEQSSPTFPRSGMTVGGLLLELPMLALRTNVTGSGLSLPTPTASQMPCEGTVRIMRKQWQQGLMSLEEASAIAGRDVRLAQGKVPAMRPTPVRSDHQMRRPTERWAGTDLVSTVWTETGGRENPNQPPALLNATWVEWLMGWPLGWTDLKPLATVRCHSAPQQPSENSRQLLTEAA